MIIYTGALLWILLLFLINSHGRISLTEKQEVTGVLALWAMFYLVFFIGLRSAGADTAAYIYGYNLIVPGFENAISTLFDFGKGENFFSAYGILMKTIFGSNYTPYLFGIAAISGFSISKCLHRYSESFFTSMMLFILWGTWSWMFNGIRQFMAVAIVFASLHMIEEKKPFQYILMVLIASRIHASAIIMIPAYFLVRSEPWKTSTLIAMMGTMFAVFFTGAFLNTIGLVTEGTEYNSILSSSYFTGDTGSNPIRTLVFAIPTFLAFMERETIERDAPTVIKICVNMSILCVCVSVVANVTSGIYIGRLPIFFSVYNMILLPWLFCHTNVGRRNGWIPAIMLLYTAYFIYEHYIYGHTYYMSEILNLRIL